MPSSKGLPDPGIELAFTTAYNIDNKDLLHSTGNSTQSSVTAYMGKNLKRMDTCAHNLNHFAVLTIVSFN